MDVRPHETVDSADPTRRHAAGRRLPHNAHDERIHRRLLQTTHGRNRFPSLRSPWPLPAPAAKPPKKSNPSYASITTPPMTPPLEPCSLTSPRPATPEATN